MIQQQTILVTEIAYPRPSVIPGTNINRANVPGNVRSTHVRNYGITKTVLCGSHGYGLASHLTPDSSQVRAFVKDFTGIEPSNIRGWSRYGFLAVLTTSPITFTHCSK